MTRVSTISVSLTAKELKLVREKVKQGDYVSESEMIRDGLKRLFQQNGAKPISADTKRSESQRLAAAYRAMSIQDRKLAREWSSLDDQWPNS